MCAIMVIFIVSSYSGSKAPALRSTESIDESNCESVDTISL